VVLSCIPGLGHLYLGLYQRGLAFFVATIAVVYIGESARLGPLLFFFLWGFAFIDAYRQAIAINLLYETGAMPDPVQLPKQRGSLGFGAFLLVLGVLLLYNQFYPLDLTFLVDWWPMVLVLAGAYLLVKHFLEQKKARETERPTTDSF